ncbi:UDP pyrophosphate phosphatase, partial [Halomonas sp. MG34]|nr:UDP pyrophosphate phosphatase [Halomonas sp. MG34]
MKNMTELWTLIKYLILGLFQGFTEPIPISSSGHIVILKNLFDLEIKGLSFEILVNFGSLIAVLLIFRHDIIRLVKNGVIYINKRDEKAKGDFQFILFLIIATIRTVILRLLFDDIISETLSTPSVVG